MSVHLALPRRGSAARSSTSLPRWASVALIGLALVLATSFAITDIPATDLWWQMKTGEWIATHGRVPTADPFSFTAPGHPWLAQEWSVELLFFFLYSHLGPFSLVAFKLLAALAAFALLFARCLRRSGDVAVSAALVLLAACAVRWYLDIRPQAVSFVLLGALLWVLEERRAASGERRATNDRDRTDRIENAKTRKGESAKEKRSGKEPSYEEARNPGRREPEPPGFPASLSTHAVSAFLSRFRPFALSRSQSCRLPWRRGSWVEGRGSFVTRGWWLVPGIMFVWANSHAAFVLGLGIVAVYVVEGLWISDLGFRMSEWGRPRPDRRRTIRNPQSQIRNRWLWVGLVSVGAALVNPYSYHALLYPLLLTRHRMMMSFNEEWMSPSYQAVWYWPHLALIVLLLGALALSRRPRRFADIAISGALLHLSLVSNRHIPLFALAITPVIAEHLADALRRFRDRSPTFARPRVLAGAVALCLAAALPMRLARLPRRDWFGFCTMQHTFPVAACDFLDRQGWSGPLFNDLVWGGYLIWRYDGKRPVFVDGRNEVFFESSFPDFYRVARCEADAEEILDGWGIETVLIIRYQLLEHLLRRSPNWQVAYQDEVAIVFDRSSAGRATVNRQAARVQE